MQGVHVVVWLNNFNELKYTCNPLRRNISHSSTAFAVLNVIPSIPFGGYLTLKEMALRALPVITALLNTSLRNPPRITIVKQRSRDDLRVLLDNTRTPSPYAGNHWR